MANESPANTDPVAAYQAFRGEVDLALGNRRSPFYLRRYAFTPQTRINQSVTVDTYLPIVERKRRSWGSLLNPFRTEPVKVVGVLSFAYSRDPVAEDSGERPRLGWGLNVFGPHKKSLLELLDPIAKKHSVKLKVNDKYVTEKFVLPKELVR